MDEADGADRPVGTGVTAGRPAGAPGLAAGATAGRWGGRPGLAAGATAGRWGGRPGLAAGPVARPGDGPVEGGTGRA